ncbi:MAG: ribosomal RNA small subunit methyltransferase A [Phycisphaerales bacterium]|nr:ribosomal RNA small subunit methyltransferase A [Phycisphaerales bacterium]
MVRADLQDTVTVHNFPAVVAPDDATHWAGGAVAHILECFDARADKWNAVRRLAAERGIEPARIVAIGDQVNDVSMIRGAGLGVAMGNAIEPVREAAAHVTRSNAEDGVAHAIGMVLAGSGDTPMAQTAAEIKDLLASRGLAPQKRFGQNFLIDQNLVRKLVDEAHPAPGELVLEVGPGTGTLTEELLSRGCEVIACELDRGLAGLLRERLGARPGFTLVEGDCLAGKRHISTEIVGLVGARPFVLIANLPYGAATPLMLALLVEHPHCRGMFVTIQKEVGDRLAAPAGGDAYGSISVVAHALATVRTIARLPPECFWPRPEVTSVMIAVERRASHGIEHPAGFADFCQRVFENRRKQLGSVLGRDFPWPGGIDPTVRAERLTPEQIVGLWRAARA